MWRPRDRERYIGGYDPEREMPDPDRDRGDRWQSSAYRHNARDSRFAYRWNPDRIEERYPDRYSDYDRGPRWQGDARDYDRDRGGYRGGFGGESGYDRGYDRDFSPRYGRGDYDRGFDRYSGRDYERDWDRERYARDRWDRGYGDDYDRGYGRPYDEYDRDRWRR